MRVFVVEDDAVVAIELDEALRRLGYEVCGHALRGEQALAMVPVARPDLILMDVNLGPGLSGLDVAHRLGRDVRILFLSGYPPAELAQCAPPGRPFHCAVKPLSLAALAAAIRAALSP